MNNSTTRQCVPPKEAKAHLYSYQAIDSESEQSLEPAVVYRTDRGQSRVVNRTLNAASATSGCGRQNSQVLPANLCRDIKGMGGGEYKLQETSKTCQIFLTCQNTASRDARLGNKTILKDTEGAS